MSVTATMQRQGQQGHPRCAALWKPCCERTKDGIVTIIFVVVIVFVVDVQSIESIAVIVFEIVFVAIITLWNDDCRLLRTSINWNVCLL